MNNEVITFSNYSKCYNKKLVLDNINLKFYKGKTYGIIGRNGSGKTILLKAISGLINPSKGFVMVNEKVIGKDIDFPENLGILIENPGFLGNKSGFENLHILADIRKVISVDKIKNTMKFVGLDPEEKKVVKKYSLGMKQRLGIAQAIMEDPEVLLLDEPMNSIDKSGVEDIRNYILELKKKNITIILTSHNLEDINILCDEVYEMDNGNIEKVSG